MKTFLTIAALIVFVVPGVCQAEQQSISLGNKLYKQKQFNKAAAEYQKAAGSNEKSADARYNLGNALYRSNKLADAEKSFDLAAENAPEENKKSKAFYNKGVSLSNQQKLQESIDAYKQSLRLVPDDTDARENLQKALNELKKQQQKSSSSKDDDKKKDKDNDKKDDPKKPQPNKSKLNEKQAEQMLNALRQEEKAIQKDQQKNKSRNGNVPEKDW